MDLYVSTTCPQCAPVKDLLARLGNTPGLNVRYTDRDPAAIRDLRAIGGRGIPALHIGDKLVMGGPEVGAVLQREFGRR